MPEGATVRQVLEKLRLPKEVRVTVLVNNNSVDQNAVLKEGDILHILPQMVGG
jgi:molybdopterin converting factor small subunit